MKTLKNIFASLILITFATVNVNAQDNVAAASTEATIIKPIEIVKILDLNFGNIVANVAGAVTVDPEGGRTTTGPTLPDATPGSFSAASFDVTGLADATYTISLSSTSFNVTRVGGTETMLVDNIITSPTPTGTLDGEGTGEITVGATINVVSGQEPGVYSNADALQITVNYN